MPADHFAVFALPRLLNLDAAALEKSFYAQSRKLHPDRFASKPAAEQEGALARSSLLNDAYRTLRDPILRTQHLLALEGVELEEQSKSATEAARSSGTQKKQLIPPELLEEVFELNMQLMEMKAAKEFGEEADAALSEENPALSEENPSLSEENQALKRDLEAASASFHGKLADTQRDLEALWQRWDSASTDAERAAARDAMVALLNKRSYLRNLVRDVTSALE